MRLSPKGKFESADGNASTEYPAARSINLNPCLTAASSSTTNTLLSGIDARFRLGYRQIDDEDRAGMIVAHHSEAAAV